MLKHLFLKTKRIFIFSGIICCVQPCFTQVERLDRQPVVAGQFYPSDKTELTALLDKLFNQAEPSKNIPDVVAVIVPHAGYVYSGAVASSGFNQIDPRKEYDNIIVIGSSHHVAFEGASIYSKGDFITPLGTVKVNTELCNTLIKKHDVFSFRPDAHEKEHSLEVQLPFLQYKLKKNFRIVPIVLGTNSPEVCKSIAEALRPFLTVKNLFVISTDFSHYPNYNDAISVDRASASAILTGSPEKVIQSIVEISKKDIPNLATSICGWTSVLTMMYMLDRNPEFVVTQIQYRNSGDVEIGDKNRVVGYNAFVISQKHNNNDHKKSGSKPTTTLDGNKQEEHKFTLTQKDKRILLSIARKTVNTYVKEQKIPDIDTSGFTPTLKSICGAFVTLNKHQRLRGCIGRFEPDVPLYRVIQQMAIASSTQDTRFMPVDKDELNDLEVEISVLTPMRRIRSIDEIELGKHGIYIRKGGQSGTFLPQVAQETGWTKEEFLGHCAQDKAGIGWNGWKDADIYIYEAIVFSESDTGK